MCRHCLGKNSMLIFWHRIFLEEVVVHLDVHQEFSGCVSYLKKVVTEGESRKRSFYSIKT